MPDGLFCARLRRERERRQILLSSISANTKIRVGLFESLERGDVSRWPAGIYRRSIIRAYAAGVGLDPDATAREFLENFPDPDEVAPLQAPDTTPAAPENRLTGLRLTLADGGAPFTAGRVLLRMRDRLAAAAFDAGVVLAIATSAFVASKSFWLPLAVSMLGYYVGGILLLGNTPGVCLRTSLRRRPAERSLLIMFRSRTAKAALALFARFKRPPSVPGSFSPVNSGESPRFH